MEASSQRAGSTRWVLVVAPLVLLALVLWGGYSKHWSWTGINGHTATLWDWLKLLLLPITVAVLPIWMVRDLQLDQTVKRVALVAASVFSLIVLFGYLVPWGWTGFTGNTLWDWLNLVALPVTVALVPFFGDLRSDWRPQHTWVGVSLAAGLAIVIAAGYLVPWPWTGFTGNKLWQWLHLLLLPLIVPAVVIPALKPRAQARMIATDDAVVVAPESMDAPVAARPEPAAAPDTD